MQSSFVVKFWCVAAAAKDGFKRLCKIANTWKNYTVSAIVECLFLENEIRVSKQGVWQFLK